MAGARWRSAGVDLAAAAIVAAIALALAGQMFAAYYAHPDGLWRGVYHDRNGHLAAAMNLALAVKAGDAARFFTQLLAMTVWGPLHALCLAAVFLAGGVDHRLAILPSLAGWVTTAVFGYLSARAMFAERPSGLFAGALAAVWIMASPAFRLLGSDVMLEGLGAGLSALGLWLYQRARAAPDDAGRWRALGLALTFLFFEKANYWGLLVAALALNELPVLRRIGADLAAWSRGRIGFAGWRLFADPLLLAAIATGLAAAALQLRGPSAIDVFGHRVSLYPPSNLVTLAYALFFARLCLTWRAHRGKLRERLGAAGRALLFWHVTPLAVSFLIPRRLASFLWFVGPANSRASAGYDPIGGALLYAHGFLDAFSPTLWIGLGAATLALVGAALIRRYPVGGRAVFVFAATCAVALVAHPQHQARFLASWIFAVWICAGAGAAMLLERLPGKIGGWPRAAAASAGVALAAISAFGAAPRPAAYVAAIRLQSGPSDLDLVRPWLGAVAGSRTLGVAATFGPSELFTWASEERCQCEMRVEHPGDSAFASRDEAKLVMLGAIIASHAQRWVVIDAPRSPYVDPGLGYTYDNLSGLVDAMAVQHRFHVVGVYPLPSEQATATVYAPDP